MAKLICSTIREGYSIDQIRRTMTVGELIDFLTQYDEDTPVYLSFDNGYTYGGITEERFEEDYGEDTQIETILETLRASLAKTIIFVGNNVRAAETAAFLPEKNVLFAFTSAAGRRESNYVDSVDLRKITVGPLRNAPSQGRLIQEIFTGTKYKVTYEPNMEDYLLCHAAFVLPAVFACYKTDGSLKKLKKDNAYLNRLIDANIEGYRAIRNTGHEILPDADKEFEGAKYCKTCFRFFKLMCATALGKICASDHAMNAVDEMRALNRDMKAFFDAAGAKYPVWQALEAECGRYLL